MNLKIGHRKFRVVPFDTVGGPNAGLIDFEAQTISLATDVSPEEQARVLIHELLHAAWEMAGAGTALTEEAVCETLDGPLAAIFSDNPHIFGVLRLALNHGEAIVTLPVDGVKETPFSSLPSPAAHTSAPEYNEYLRQRNKVPKAPTHLEAWAAWGKQTGKSSSLAMHNENVRAYDAEPAPIPMIPKGPTLFEKQQLQAGNLLATEAVKGLGVKIDPRVSALKKVAGPSYQQDERFFDYIKFGGPPGKGTQPTSSIEYALSTCNND